MTRWQRAGSKLVMLLLAAALLLGLFGTFQSSRTVQHWTRLFGAEENGSWSALSIDRRPVSSEDYRVSVDGRKVAGGRDGCNDWSYQEKRDPNGERMIVTTLQACPEDDPVRVAYHVLVHDPQARLELQADGTLRLAAGGHEGLFRRCYWQVETTPTSTMEVCRPEPESDASQPRATR